MTADPDARLTVDVGAVVANWRLLRDRRGPGGAVGAAVKADAYGLGAAAIAPALRDAGCRHFFVATLGEGVALRAALADPAPMVAVLNGFAPGADGDAGLTPVLNALGDVEAHARAGREAGAPPEAILHLDTGMARLGLDDAEQARLLADPSRLDGLRLRTVMSHLACADEPAHPLNAAQAARFAAIRARLPGVPGSLANSAGQFLGGIFRSDLERPGCALYGINPTPGRPNPMRQTVTVEARVLQVREVGAGTPVGYAAAWIAPRASRIATVAAGYADGYLRALSGRSAALPPGAMGDGRPLPLVGRVSMDLLTFDATDHPALRPGDFVTLVGDADGIRPDDLAARAGTIGYEVLTSLGARYARRWVTAGE